MMVAGKARETLVVMQPRGLIISIKLYVAHRTNTYAFATPHTFISINTEFLVGN